MKKHLTEIVFMLNRSGSVAGLEEDTIGGLNTLIAQQKKEPGEKDNGIFECKRTVATVSGHRWNGI